MKNNEETLYQYIVQKGNNNEEILYQYIVQMDNKICENINSILEMYNISFQGYKFLITPKGTFEECNELRKKIVTYPIFTIFYEKVEYDTKGIKVIINSEILNSIQKQVSGMSPTSEIYLVYFKEQNLTENSKKELVEKLNKMFNNQKNRKLAHQIINLVELASIDIGDNELVSVGFYYLGTYDGNLKFRKIHIQEKTGISGKTMSRRFELLRDIYGINMNQFQPHFDKKDNNTVNSNYEFNIKEFEPISILTELLEFYPLPKSRNDFDYLEAIESKVFSDNAEEYEKYFKEGINKIKKDTVQKHLQHQYPFQILLRFQYELSELIKHISLYFKQVNQSNIYEATALYEKLNNYILRILLENNSEKSNYNNFLNELNFDGPMINVDEEIIIEKYNDFKDTIELYKNDFGELYDQYEVFNSITKLTTLEEGKLKWDKIFVDKYKLKTPFIDKILIDDLIKNNSQYIGSQSMLEREYNKNGNFIFDFFNFQDIMEDRELDDEIDDLIFCLDSIGNRLLKKVVSGGSKNIKYSNALLKEIRRMLKVLDLYYSEKSNFNMIHTYYKLQQSDDGFDKRIKLLTKELVYLRIKKELFNNSKYTPNE